MPCSLLLQNGTDMQSLAAVIPPPSSNWLANVTDPDIRQCKYPLAMAP